MVSERYLLRLPATCRLGVMSKDCQVSGKPEIHNQVIKNARLPEFWAGLLYYIISHAYNLVVIYIFLVLSPTRNVSAKLPLTETRG